MIVISGALVLVALVLLVIGLIQPDLAFVYASIGVSLASFVFLVIGIIQRRREDLPVEGSPVATPAQDNRVVPVASPIADGDAVRPRVAAASDLPNEDASGTVLVVEGRPRYHVEGCRYLAGKDAKALAVDGAREEGFTACGVCKPDLALESVVAPASTPAVSLSKPSVEEAPTAVQELAEPVVATKVARTAKAPTAVQELAEPVVATKVARTAKAPTKVAPANAPAKAAAAKAPSKAAAAKVAPAKAAPVIVIPDRGKFHTPGCRYVRDAVGAVELTKATASKQGYDACGVCKP